jgi:hypothetical protein
LPSDTTNDHIEKSDHDYEVANFLSSNTCYCDWRWVCTFYSVIHRIDAYAHKTHKENELVPPIWEQGKWYDLRRKFVKNNLKDYYGLYDRLCNISMDCRYDPKYYKKFAHYPPVYFTKLSEAIEKFRRATQ